VNRIAVFTTPDKHSGPDDHAEISRFNSSRRVAGRLGSHSSPAPRYRSTGYSSPL